MKTELLKTVSDWTYHLYKTVIAYLFILIISALLFIAAFSTTFLDRYEQLYFLPDNPIINVFALFLTILAFFAGHQMARCEGKLKQIADRIERDEYFFLRVKAMMLWICCGVISLWVICTRVPATADQRAIMLAAQAMAARDFTSGSPATYFYIYNNLTGITMLLYLLNLIFGDFNYVAYQLLNALCIVAIVKQLSELAEFFGAGKIEQLMIIALGMLFAPLNLYSSFIYGTIPGLLFALMAVKKEILYFRSGVWKQAISAAFYISIAILLKMNYIIFMTGMLVVALIELIHSRKISILVLPILIVLFFFAQSKLPIVTYEKMSGQTLPDGMSWWGWVTMGLQDGQRPGWYNNYSHFTFEESDYDVEKQARWVKSDLKLRVQEMWKNKNAARDFFVRKTASQWNEPSFQSVWISITHFQDKYEQNVITVDNDWPKLLLSPKGNHTLTQYLNYLNFIILSGSMLYLLLCSKSEHFHDSLIFPMIFIGGFLFHLVWEAKGQYALPYFVLLLPYTVMGYSAAAEGLSKLISGERKTGSALCVSKKEIAVKLVLLAAGVLILWYVFHGTMGSLTCDTEAYMNYLAQHS